MFSKYHQCLINVIDVYEMSLMFINNTVFAVLKQTKPHSVRTCTNLFVSVHLYISVAAGSLAKYLYMR